MEAVIVIAMVVGVVLLMRAFGAWMLRINDVIDLQKEILKELKKQNQ